MEYGKLFILYFTINERTIKHTELVHSRTMGGCGLEILNWIVPFRNPFSNYFTKIINVN